jgi:hypothetical protein
MSSDQSDVTGSVWDVDSDISSIDKQQMETMTSISFSTDGRILEPAHTSVSELAHTSVSELAHTSVLELPLGLSPILSSFIVVNYISAGYILLPWGESTQVVGTLLVECLIL